MTRWLLPLWLIWATLLFGGYLGGSLQARGRDAGRRMPAWTRMASSVVLTLCGWTLAALARSTAADQFALLIAVGMTLGLAGDLLLARLIPVKEPVLAGMAAFAAGHVAYIVGGLNQWRATGVDGPGLLLAAWIAWLALGVLGWWAFVYRGQRITALHWAALPYALLLASTAGVATGLAFHDAKYCLFALGAALFLLSDLLIAAGLFSHRTFRRVALDDVVWLTYGPGQMLIVFTVYAVLRSLS